MQKLLLKIVLINFWVVLTGWSCLAQVNTDSLLMKEIDALQNQLVPDKRVAILEITLRKLPDASVVLTGETNLPEGKESILKLLAEKRVHFIDSMRVLPDASTGNKTWGLATLSVSNMRFRPGHAAEMVSQVLMGTPVKVLDKSGGWYRIQTPDTYIGWIDGSGIALKTGAEMEVWKQNKRLVYRQIAGYALATPQKNGQHVSDLVLGDIFEMISKTKGFIEVRFPDGRTAFVKGTDCKSFQQWAKEKPEVGEIIAVARQLLGAPYLWGGTSSKAVDCSGMVKTAYYSQGVILARDASQQARNGEHPDFKNINALQPGDLLFFGRNPQKVTHVGLYMGKGKYIHSSGLVRINSIDPNAPDFNLSNKKNMVESSRILNSLNTEGIALVKNHPWYVNNP